MEENLHYSSRSDSKRKFDDQGAPPSPVAPASGRRPTGFSAPITSLASGTAAPTSYNNVHPPPDGIELAKQRAQEIAARLFSDAEAKRPRVENGDGADDSKDKGFRFASGTAAPTSYNNVHPPPDGIELAKQRAQEIAARFFSDAEAKRPRVENGDGADDSKDKGFRFDQSSKPIGSTISSQVGMTPPMSYSSYGYPGSSKKIDIPNGRVGVIIGKSGETIKYLQVQSGAKIQVTRDVDADPNSHTRCVELIGTPEQINKAEQLVNDVLAEAEVGTSTTRKFVTTPVGAEHFSMKVPNNKVGLIIGKGGESIRNMQATSGARIQVIPLHLPPGETLTERTVHIDGTKEQIESAKQLVNDVISENRPRNPSAAGGYSAYRPPTSWVPPGAPPVQQPGYGFVQPGAYPSPLQYNTSQPPYGGYQAPTASGWDQSSNPAAQQNTQGSGYDYYSQQQQQQPQSGGGSSAPSDTNSYSYNQNPPTYNPHGSYVDPTYSQQAYGQPGSYAQPIPNSQAGYAAHQVYGSGATAGSTQEGSAINYAATQGGTQQAPPSQPSVGQQGYAAQQPGSVAQSGYGMPPSQTGYGSQPAGQTGYLQSATSAQPSYGHTPVGQNLAQNQVNYGQTQPSPTSQSGFAQPIQSYSQPSQGYSQPAPASSGYAPPSGYATGVVPSGYGQQPHVGASQNPATGYVQQVYSDAYGAIANSQPPYSSDATHGSYDAPSASQAAPSGVTKASPQI